MEDVKNAQQVLRNEQFRLEHENRIKFMKQFCQKEHENWLNNNIYMLPNKNIVFCLQDFIRNYSKNQYKKKH